MATVSDQQPEPDGLERWEVPGAGLTLVEMTTAGADALADDARDETLSDRDFAAQAVTRQLAELGEDAASWPDDRLNAALASLAAHDELDGSDAASIREAVKARDAAVVEQLASQVAATPAFGPMGKTLADMVRSGATLPGSRTGQMISDIVAADPSVLGKSMVGTELAKILAADPSALGKLGAGSQIAKFNFGAGIDPAVLKAGSAGEAMATRLGKTVADAAAFNKGLSTRERIDMGTSVPAFRLAPRPDYDAQTAAGVKQLGAFAANTIELAATQARELTALNARVDELSGKAATTNESLAALVRSITPKWVFYLTLLAAIGAVVVGIIALQPRPAAPAPTPIMTAAPSPS
jgi:hypothetical protein